MKNLRLKNSFFILTVLCFLASETQAKAEESEQSIVHQGVSAVGSFFEGVRNVSESIIPKSTPKVVPFCHDIKNNYGHREQVKIKSQEILSSFFCRYRESKEEVTECLSYYKTQSGISDEVQTFIENVIRNENLDPNYAKEYARWKKDPENFEMQVIDQSTDLIDAVDQLGKKVYKGLRKEGLKVVSNPVDTISERTPFSFGKALKLIQIADNIMQSDSGCDKIYLFEVKGKGKNACATYTNFLTPRNLEKLFLLHFLIENDYLNQNYAIARIAEISNDSLTAVMAPYSWCHDFVDINEKFNLLD